MSRKRPGKPGRYFSVLNWASENGLSSETWARLLNRSPRPRRPGYSVRTRGASLAHAKGP